MKNHTVNHHDHHHHAVENKGKLLFVIFLNSAITLAEYIGGLVSGSLALISDAGHNLSDVLALMLGYAAEKVSDRKPDKKFSFGLKRFEVAIALVNALSLIGIGIYIVYEAVTRYFGSYVIDVTIMLPVAGIGLAGNLFSILVLVKNRKSNLNIKAAFLHLFFDTLSSVAVIIAGVVIYFSRLFWLDLAISLVIVFMIIGSSISILREAIRIFLQGTPPHIEPDEVLQSIISIKDVGGVHGLHIWSINSTEVFLSCHICMDSGDGTADTDKIIRNVNVMLDDTFGITHTTLQIEKKLICDIDSDICCR
jgi:cobalt-zinc-cadmium efflux system protein